MASQHAPICGLHAKGTQTHTGIYTSCTPQGEINVQTDAACNTHMTEATQPHKTLLNGTSCGHGVDINYVKITFLHHKLGNVAP